MYLILIENLEKKLRKQSYLKRMNDLSKITLNDDTTPVVMLPLGIFISVFEKLQGGRSLVFVNTEEREDQGVKLGILELPLHGTPRSLPLEHVPLGPEEMLPVVSDVGEDRPQTPHVGRGVDVRIISSEDLRSQVADSSTTWSGVVVHGRGGCTWKLSDIEMENEGLCRLQAYRERYRHQNQLS